MQVGKEHLYLTAALTWGIPGIMITIKGLRAYCDVLASQVWWLMMLTGLALLMFHRIFRQLVKRYSNRIVTLPEKCALWQTFPTRGWCIIFFMMGLGVALKLVPVSTSFIAFFYSGLGPMLIISAIRFFRKR